MDYYEKQIALLNIKAAEDQRVELARLIVIADVALAESQRLRKLLGMPASGFTRNELQMINNGRTKLRLNKLLAKS